MEYIARQGQPLHDHCTDTGARSMRADCDVRMGRPGTTSSAVWRGVAISVRNVRDWTESASVKALSDRVERHGFWEAIQVSDQDDKPNGHLVRSVQNAPTLESDAKAGR